MTPPSMLLTVTSSPFVALKPSRPFSFQLTCKSKRSPAEISICSRSNTLYAFDCFAVRVTSCPFALRAVTLSLVWETTSKDSFFAMPTTFLWKVIIWPG